MRFTARLGDGLYLVPARDGRDQARHYGHGGRRDFDKAGELLLQHRSDGSGWGLIGGFMELGESLEAAARREVLEETELMVGDLELFGVFEDPGLTHIYDNGDQAQIITVTYLTDRATGVLQTDSEGLELRYFPLDALPEPLFTPNAPIFAAIHQRFGPRI